MGYQGIRKRLAGRRGIDAREGPKIDAGSEDPGLQNQDVAPTRVTETDSKAEPLEVGGSPW